MPDKSNLSGRLVMGLFVKTNMGRDGSVVERLPPQSDPLHQADAMMIISD